MRGGRTLALLIAALAAAAAPGPRGDDLVVSTAISLKEPLLEAIDEFAISAAGQGLPRVDVHAGGSSILVRQVVRGVPGDLVVVASRADAEHLVQAGRAKRSSVCVLAGNTLVLVVPRGGPRLEDLNQLREPRFERVAMAHPRAAPLGRYTAQALEAAGLKGPLEAKRIPAEHARQVVDYVVRGEVDAAVVYRTDAARFADRVSVAFEIDPTLHDPIEYIAVLLDDGDPWSERLFTHLCSETGRARFEDAGFRPWPGPR